MNIVLIISMILPFRFLFISSLFYFLSFSSSLFISASLSSTNSMFSYMSITVSLLLFIFFLLAFLLFLLSVLVFFFCFISFSSFPQNLSFINSISIFFNSISISSSSFALFSFSNFGFSNLLLLLSLEFWYICRKTFIFFYNLNILWFWDSASIIYIILLTQKWILARLLLNCCIVFLKASFVI